MTALEDGFARGAATTCRAWLLRRRDGLVLGFTDHDMPLMVDGVRCLASSGLSAGALERSTGLAVDNVAASGALSHDAIKEADIRAGRWDAAAVDIWLVDWTDTAERRLLFRGSLGEITHRDGAFSVELRGMAEALNMPVGRVFQPRCDAILGDARCGVALGPSFAVEVEVTGIRDGRVIELPPLGQFAADWFERGRMAVISGAAAGLEERIKVDRAIAGARVIELWSALRAPVVAGDRIRLEAGCDKRRETCREKFGNILNFRGFADIPGEDWLMSHPVAADNNDGGRG
jgi:uncharacterized phage protein (TIGR02218 family)